MSSAVVDFSMVESVKRFFNSDIRSFNGRPIPPVTKVDPISGGIINFVYRVTFANDSLVGQNGEVIRTAKLKHAAEYTAAEPRISPDASLKHLTVQDWLLEADREPDQHEKHIDLAQRIGHDLGEFLARLHSLTSNADHLSPELEHVWHFFEENVPARDLVLESTFSDVIPHLDYFKVNINAEETQNIKEIFDSMIQEATTSPWPVIMGDFWYAQALRKRSQNRKLIYSTGPET
ncbi:hypothetical protein QQZ08_004993 [Neonectria magnoliae]|uniref:Aminoglycoside phosphotransferase domain-containing protein n=1 Tax=Neonectria magnoliae TaxID=2732573 RepID=A0ABR1I6D0_9HYPO